MEYIAQPSVLDQVVLLGNGPFYARSASDNTDDWPFWYVAGPDKRLNVLSFKDQGGAKFTSRKRAEEIAEAANREV